MGFEVGDIVKDISEEYIDLNLTGVIEAKATIIETPVFHVRFFGSDEIMCLYSHEIVKVS